MIDTGCSSDPVNQSAVPRIHHPTLRIISDRLYDSALSKSWYTTSTSPPGVLALDMELDVPSFGIVFMNPPVEARLHAERLGIEPEYEVALNGQLRIKLPGQSQAVQYQSIHIGFKVVSRIANGEGIIEDELYKVERRIVQGALKNDNSFDFSFPIPSTTAPRDWHPKAVVFNYLYAEVEGDPLDVPMSKPQKGLPPLLARFNPFSQQGVKSSPQPPIYEPSSNTLQGRHQALRVIRLIYNPNPLGDVNTLNEHATGVSPELGSYDIRLFSDIWTLSCPVRANLALLDIPSTTTIYSFRVSLLQTHTIRSLRPHSIPLITQHRTAMSRGKTPDKHREFPEPNHPALWRGKGAGGDDDGALILELHDRVAYYETIVRPSTLPTVITPIQVDHVIDMDIYFSVQGVGANGVKLKQGGIGGLRVMRIRRKVMLPSCCILPKNVDLPIYDATPEEIHLSADPTHPWGQCACSLSLEEITARMKAASVAEQVAVSEAQEIAAAKALAEGRAV